MQTFQQIVPDFKACVGCLNTSRGELPATFCPVLHNPPTSTFLDEGAANLYFFQSVSRLYGPSLFKIQQVSVYCQDLHASTAFVSRFLSASSFSQGSKIEGILVVAALVLSSVASILCQHPAIHNLSWLGSFWGQLGDLLSFCQGWYGTSYSQGTGGGTWALLFSLSPSLCSTSEQVVQPGQKTWGCEAQLVLQSGPPWLSWLHLWGALGRAAARKTKQQVLQHELYIPGQK